MNTGTDLPAEMPVAVYRAVGDVVVETRAVPSPGAGEVLASVSHCGVCGSDLHMMVEGWGKPGYIGGHEWTGTIAAVGPDVEGWSLGDLVVGGPSPKCGRCRRCLEGQPSQCENRRGDIADDQHQGAFAAYILLDARSLVALPEGLSMRDAALAEPLAVALHGITRSGVVDGDRALVIGAGPIGALTIAALVARGITVLAVEPAPARAELAAQLGAEQVLHPDELQTFPMWEPERISDLAVDVVLECSGKKVAIEAGFNQLRRGGRLVMVGAGIEPPTFDPNRMLLNELEVCGSFVYDADGFDRALELLTSGRLRTDLLIDPDDVPLDRLPQALEGLATGRIAGKAMVVPRLAGDPKES
jgi:(R,R)-butanediol dehydrogenase / meso-butanediol dehydrogenase / diacetyl reductase